MNSLTKEDIAAVDALAKKIYNKYEYSPFQQSHYPKGMAFYNALRQLFPEVGQTIMNTSFDPFFVDSRIDSCKRWIQRKDFGEQMPFPSLGYN
jgi:hypothetical protein